MKIAIVDDHDIFRESMMLLLEHKSTHHVLGGFASVAQCLAHTWAELPDCLVLDYHLAERNSLQDYAAIQAQWPNIRIIFLTGTLSVGVLKQLQACKPQGVLHKRDDAQTLVSLLNKVAQGERVVSPQYAKHLEVFDFDFTDKEWSVLQFLLQGQSTKEAADHLGVSRRTVEKHKENMMRKSGIHSLAQLLEIGHKLESS
jgi:DNA-binding NarL/FixJ family response regulator